MHHVPLAFQCIYGCSDEGEDGDGKEGSEIPVGGGEWNLPDLLYADNLVVCSESEEDLTVMGFLKVCRKRGLKINAFKSNEMVMNGEEGLQL